MIDSLRVSRLHALRGRYSAKKCAVFVLSIANSIFEGKFPWRIGYWDGEGIDEAISYSIRRIHSVPRPLPGDTFLVGGLRRANCQVSQPRSCPEDSNLNSEYSFRPSHIRSLSHSAEHDEEKFNCCEADGISSNGKVGSITNSEFGNGETNLYILKNGL
jgi:hypothetical protein